MMNIFICVALILANLCLSWSSPTPDIICNKHASYIYTESTGDLYSPGYLSNESYPEDLDCKWSILIPSGEYLRITFQDLDLDDSISCEADSLTFTASSLTEQVLVKVICGSIKPTDFAITGYSLLTIEFVSDYIFSGRGFHISWSTQKKADICKSNEFTCATGDCVSISSRCNGKFDCVDGSDEVRCSQSMTSEYTCGKTPISPDVSGFTDRILGGDPVIPGSWPWQADLQLNVLWPSGHFCGGALIHPQYVLTAGHCSAAYPQPELLRVVLGNYDSFKQDEYEQIRYVDQITTYGVEKQSSLEDFDYINDISLIKLNAPVNITNGVIPVCLADSSKPLTPGTKCYVTGWGSTRGTGSSGILKQLPVEIEDINECFEALNEEEEFDLTGNSQYCIRGGGGGSGVCSGDSGGPLVCLVEGSWYLYGVASKVTSGTIIGPICGDGKGNAVYTNVPSKLTWIQNLMKG